MGDMCLLIHMHDNPDSDYEDPTTDSMNVDGEYDGGEAASNRDTFDNIEENPDEEFDGNPEYGTGDSSTVRKRKLEDLLDTLHALIKTFT